MKRKSWTRVTRDVLLDAPLPEATDTYTVISHSFCINTIKKLLSVKGFKVVNEIYSATDGAQIATGMFHINHGDDPELGMLFAFANSYNKKVKFSCSVGAYVKVNETSILTEGGSAWIRKHTGNADQLAEEVIKQQVEDATTYFDQLLKDKEAMKLIRLNQTQYAELLGRLYLDVQILAIGQVSHVRSEYHKPSYTYDADNNSLWTLYNHILLALAKSHPKTWMDQQKLVHLHISTVFDLAQFDEVVDDTLMESEENQNAKPELLDTPEVPGVLNGAIDFEPNAMEPSEEEKAEMLEAYQEDVEAGEYPDDDERTEVLTDEEIEEATEVKAEGFDNTTIDDHEELEEVVDLETDPKEMIVYPPLTNLDGSEPEPFVTDEEEDAVMESLLKPIDVEAVRELEEIDAGSIVETQSMTVEVAVKKFGHMLTEEELAGVQNGNLNQGTIDKLKELATQYDVVNEQVDKVITEELAKTGTDGKSYLPQDPSKVKAEMEELIEPAEEIEEVVENEVGVDDFFMTKEDLVEMGVSDIVIGNIVTIGDEECEITHVDDESVGLCPIGAIEEEEEVVERPKGPNVIINKIAPEPIGEDFPEAEPQQMDMNFDIGEPQEAVPSENMLRTTSKSIESVTDVNDEEQAQIDAALEKMAAKVELSPAEQAIYNTIQSEIYELYGEKYEFTYKLSGTQYNVTLETDEVFVLEKSYIESLNENA